MKSMFLSWYDLPKNLVVNELPCRRLDYIAPLCQKAAEQHPEWAAHTPENKLIGTGWVYMDPNVPGFRKAKVDEAVYWIKKGYDGIRYDNGLVVDCHSKLHKHTMTYAEAAGLMLHEIVKAVRKVNPQAVVGLNNAGPDLMSVCDFLMNEGGINREDFLYDQIEEAKKQTIASYDVAHRRYLTLECLWDLIDKPKMTWDYCELGKKPWSFYTEKHKNQIYRSVIFNLLHDAQTGFGGADGFREKEYVLANKIYREVGRPLSEIINIENLALRVFSRGVILVLEKDHREFQGTLCLEHELMKKLNRTGSMSVSSVYQGEIWKTNGSRGLRLPYKMPADGFDILLLKK